MPRWFAALLVPVLTVCGGGSAGPTGEPEVVVGAAADRTTEAATVQVEAAAPDASSSGRVRLSDADARLQPTGPGSGKAYPELSQPLAVVDLVRGAVEVVSYGGTAVRGASTFRYETVIDVAQAMRSTPEARRGPLRTFSGQLAVRAFYADVWVDGDGRLRRVQVPVDKASRRPGGRDRSRPELVTVDFFDYQR